MIKNLKTGSFFHFPYAVIARGNGQKYMPFIMENGMNLLDLVLMAKAT
mgnify:CR=1 FL=1